MVARGIGAFIGGAFDGYSFGENVKDRKAQRKRQEELDRIAEEQRAIDNRRADMRDGIMQQDAEWQAYTRDQAQSDAEFARTAAEEAATMTEDAMTSPDAPADAGGAAGPVSGGGGTDTVAGNPGTDRIAAAIGVNNRQNMPPLRGAAGGPAPAAAPDPVAAALAAADEAVRQAEQTRDPQTIQAALDRRNMLYESIATTTPAQAPQRAPDPGRIAAAIGAIRRPLPPLAGPAGGPAQQPAPPPQAPVAPPPESRPNMGGIAALRGPAGSVLPVSQQGSAPVAAPTRPRLGGIGQLRGPAGSTLPANQQVAAQSAPQTPPARPAPTQGARGVTPGRNDPDRRVGVPQILSQSPLPSGRILARAIQGPAGGPVQSRDARDAATAATRPASTTQGTSRQANQTATTFYEQFRETGAPFLRDQFLRRGMVEQATQWQTWLDAEATRAGMEAYGRAAFYAEMGNMEGFSDAVVDLYNNEDYFGDGLTVDPDNSDFIRDPVTGDILGATVTFENADGETFTQTWDSQDQLVNDVLNMLAPERAFELRLQSLGAATEATRTAQTQAQERADAERKRVADIVKSLAEENLGTWATMTEQEQMDAVKQRMAMEDRLAGAATGAPQGAPPAPVPDWRG